MLLLIQVLQEVVGRQARLCILWRYPMEGSSVPNVQKTTPNRPQSSDTSKRSIWPSPTGAMCAAIVGRLTRELVTSETTWKRPTNIPRKWWTPRASRGFDIKNKFSVKMKWKKKLNLVKTPHHSCCSTPRIIIAGAFGYLTLTPALQQLEEDSTLLLGKKSWSCNKCSKSFSQQASLSRHDREVHQAQLSHPCPACPSKFPRREHLQRHLQRVHRELLLVGDITEQSQSTTTTSDHPTTTSS